MNEESNNQQPQVLARSMMGAGIAIGIGTRIAIGAAIDNIGAGIAIGAGVGVALGVALSHSASGKKA